ncbi:MAG: thiS, partial [Pseudomonas sp.]|nr:thiS [Pseudomonas sp.]
MALPWSYVLIGLECWPLKMMAAYRMRIQLNGESFELPDGETVAALLTRLELAGRRVA